MPRAQGAVVAARRLDGLPVLAVLALRPAQPGALHELLDALAQLPDCERIAPAPLSERASGVVIERTLGTPAEDAFRAACYEVTRGNPFLLEEVLRAFAAESRSQQDAGAAARVRRLGPASISRGVLGRVGTLWPEALRLARAVAVLGSDAELRHAAALAELDSHSAGAAADALAAAHVLAPGRPLRFLHPVLRQAVYEDLGPSRRASDHGRAARMLAAEGADPDRVALHLLPTEPAADEWVAKQLAVAGARALAQGAHESAVALFERALAESPPAATRAPLLLQLAMAAFGADDPRASAWAEQAVDAVGDPNTRMVAAIAAANVVTWQGHPDEATQAFFARLVQVSDSLPELALEAEATAKLFLNVLVPARAAAEASGWRPRLTAPPAGETPGERTWLAAAAWEAVMEGESASRALELAERALASGTLLAEAEMWEYQFAVSVLMCADRLDRALALIDAGLADAQRRGSPILLDVRLTNRAGIQFRRGAIADAAADVRAASDLALEHGVVQLVASRLFKQLELLCEMGEVDRAEAALADHGLATGPPQRDGWGIGLLLSRGRLRLAQRRPQTALADFLLACEWLEEMGRPDSAAFTWRPLAALAYHALGAAAEARTLAEQAVAVAGRFGAPYNLGVALRTRAAVADDSARAIADLEEAVGVFASSPARLEHAHALVDLGSALRRTGRRKDARPPLEQGMDLAAHCEATPLAERARDELRMLGARPRRLLVTGAASLTAAERRVARMAADGMSNRDIAQALFVTRRTVETHVGHIYRKLDIGSREQLTDALRSEA